MEMSSIVFLLFGGLPRDGEVGGGFDLLIRDRGFGKIRRREAVRWEKLLLCRR